MSLMQDKIFWNPEGYAEIILSGDQAAQMFESIYADFLPIQERLRSEDQPVLGLFDCSDETGFSLSSNKAALEILEKIKYDRVAMYNVPHADVTKGIIMATGKSQNTQLFKSRQEAVDWLLG